MKKKILILSPIYVGEGITKTFTPIVHYFAKEWVKNGHEVIVVHNLAYYPRLFYFIAFFFSKIIASITGTNIPKSRLTRSKEFLIDNVLVHRMPMFKLIPHFKFSRKRINSQIKNISVILARDNFTPDYVVGHWSNPQLELISRLKSKIKSCKTVLVMHDDGSSIIKLYKNNYIELINSIDYWGFRSSPIKRSFELKFGVKVNSFMCFSGIPKEFMENENNKVFKSEIKNFLFVGTLIKRKHPSKLILAIDEVYKDKDFKINYVGEGNERKGIERLIREKSLSNCVFLNGFVSRQRVQELMIDTECFIMISKGEAYGLVYLEAMAAGCIVIASKDEGFDGVIVHGFNGFLCESGNEIELAKIIRYINNLSVIDKNIILKNAFNTAINLTDEIAAKNYFECFSS